MPPRPSLKRDSQRPLSAIYIGNQSNGNHSTNNNGHASSGSISATSLPDLPEPPSPSTSVGSGLPSPPATNSTGSGSTGDPASIAVRRPAAPMTTAQNTQAQTGSSDSSSTVPSSSRSSSRLSWKPEELDAEDHLDLDEDQTMRLKIASGSSNESVLQRARILAQRNRIQLDKIASARLGRASPSSSSSSRNQRHSMPDPSQVLSGSETEREGDSTVFNSTSTTSSGSKSSTTNRVRLSSAPTSPHRARIQATGGNSGTNSPTRRRKRVSLASISVNAFDDKSDDENDFYDERMARDGERYQVGTARDRIRDRQDTLRDDRPSTRAPTVSLNSLKKTPVGGARRRSALPREFREGSADESTTEPPTPQTPYRPATASTTSSSTAVNSSTPSTSTMTSSTLGRRSTLRGSRLSDDYRSSPSYSIRDLPSRVHTTPINTSTDPSTSSTSSLSTPVSSSATPTTPASTKSAHSATEPYDNSPTILARSNTIGRHSITQRERRQTLRGGSAESALGGPGGRSLVGEGLRAAGLSRRVGVGTLREREREKTIADAKERERELDRMSLVSGSTNRSRIVEFPSQSPDVFKGEDRKVDWSPETTESLAKHRRSVLDSSELGGSNSRTLPPRASTSMADYSYTSRSRHSRMSALHSDSEEDDREDDADDYRGGRKELRAYKSAYGKLTSREASLTRREQSLLERERELGRKERELERERSGSVLGRHYTGSTVTNATPGPTPPSIMRERGERDRFSSPFGTTRRTPGGSSGSQSHQSQGHSQVQSEHAKLMVDSLTMFESQLARLTPVLGSAGTNHAEMLTRNAQTLVVNAERLNTMLKSGNSRALDAQIEAEVEGDYNNHGGSKSSLVEVWRKIGGEYREGLRASDDLVRAVTGLLLGVGRVMKEYVSLQHGGSQFGSEAGSTFGGTPRGSPVVHGRSISLGEEDVRVRGGGSGSGGISPDLVRESRRSWEPTTSSGGRERDGRDRGGSSNASVSTGTGSREEALRRLAGVRSDSPLARASPAFQAVRELDRLETSSPALGASGLGSPKVNIPAARRLFAPSQQREMALVAENSAGGDYDPSPTPASRTRVFDRGELSVPVQQQLQHSPLQTAQEVTLERSRTVTLPPQGGRTFDSPLRRNVTITGTDGGDKNRHERRKISVASIATIRAVTSNSNAGTTTSSTTSSGVSVPIQHHPSGFLTTPSGATTAVTLDTGGVASPMNMTRTESGSGSNNNNNPASSSSLYSTSTKPTFSRPEGISGLQQQLEGYRKRLESESAGVAEGVGVDASGDGRRNGGATSLMTPESERETRRKTYGSRVGARISLDSTGGRDGDTGVDEMGVRPVVDLSINAADRSAAATVAGGSVRRERRRAVTDIWARS